MINSEKNPSYTPDKTPDIDARFFARHNRPIIIMSAIAIGSALAVGLNVLADSPTNPDDTYDARVQELNNLALSAVKAGPQAKADIIGIYDLEPNDSIRNAILAKAAYAKSAIDMRDDIANAALEMSSIAFMQATSADDVNENPKFVLYKRDINNDGTAEVLATMYDPANLARLDENIKE